MNWAPIFKFKNCISKIVFKITITINNSLASEIIVAIIALEFSKNVSIFDCLFIEHVVAYEVGCDSQMKTAWLIDGNLQHC